MFIIYSEKQVYTYNSDSSPDEDIPIIEQNVVWVSQSLA